MKENLILNNRQNLPAGLWIIGTPIGNPEDMTQHATRILQSVDVLLCEDTRRMRRRCERFDAVVEKHSAPYWAEKALGLAIGLVSDAGMPCINDPGSRLVREVRRLGGSVWSVPGVSAVTTFLAASGLACPFVFQGYFDPEKLTAGLLVFFESPKRIFDTIQNLERDPACQELVLAKELTKTHEKFFYGPDLTTALTQHARDEGGIFGEWIFAVRYEPLQTLYWQDTLACMHAAGVRSSEAARIVSQKFGIAHRLCYQEVLRLAGKSDT